MKTPYYITTPIYYVNDKPHIGHAYTTIAADVIARFKRMDGYDVMFLTGTDEHGQKVNKSAENAGIDPQVFVDRVSKNFKDLMPILNVTPDRFIRTTEADHKKAAQDMWNRLVASGDIYLGSYSGWYSVRDEAFYAESELIDGKAPTGAPVEWLEEPSYFFRLSKWQEPLLTFYEQNPDFIAPVSRRNEVVKFVEGGLMDLSISRTSFNWGVKVPGDEKHVMYVWLDALTNYLTGVGFPDTAVASYKTFWPADLHLVGKDILRFHAVYWPAFLMASGLDLPKRVFAHGWWTNEGQKISKSLGNVIDPIELIDQYGADAFRYVLLREVSFGNDGDFSILGMRNRINADLANAYGNLVQRVLSFIYKQCDGIIYAADQLEPQDKLILSNLEDALKDVREAIEHQALHKVCDAIWQCIYDANAYVDAEKPWSLRKENPERMKEVLYVLCNVIKRLALLTFPILPSASKTILLQLGVTKFVYENFTEMMPEKHSIEEPYPVFPRIAEEV
ncbi:MAG: methionine--tRNA ligase [Candidatus Paracaedibacteraceae bacterium]|nr:methionine--tRNA ligase [Candidatus Paracaedibacteraceae bacterium]